MRLEISKRLESGLVRKSMVKEGYLKGFVSEDNVSLSRDGHERSLLGEKEKGCNLKPLIYIDKYENQGLPMVSQKG